MELVTASFDASGNVLRACDAPAFSFSSFVPVVVMTTHYLFHGIEIRFSCRHPDLTFRPLPGPLRAEWGTALAEPRESIGAHFRPFQGPPLLVKIRALEHA